MKDILILQTTSKQTLNIPVVSDDCGYLEIKRIISIGNNLLETYTERIYNNNKSIKINYKIETIYHQAQNSPFK